MRELWKDPEYRAKHARKRSETEALPETKAQRSASAHRYWTEDLGPEDVRHRERHRERLAAAHELEYERRRAATAERDDEIVALRRQGMMHKELAERFGVHHKTVARVLRLRDEPPPPVLAEAGERNLRIIELGRQGLGARVIAGRIGCSVATASRVLVAARRNGTLAVPAEEAAARRAQIFELRAQGLTYQEIAGRVGISMSAARQMVHRARTRKRQNSTP